MEGMDREKHPQQHRQGEDRADNRFDVEDGIPSVVRMVGSALVNGIAELLDALDNVRKFGRIFKGKARATAREVNSWLLNADSMEMFLDRERAVCAVQSCHMEGYLLRGASRVEMAGCHGEDGSTT